MEWMDVVMRNRCCIREWKAYREVVDHLVVNPRLIQKYIMLHL